MYVLYLGRIFLLPALSPPSKKPKNSHGSHTETMGATGHYLYRHIWPSGAGSNLWCAFIGSWVMPPSTGSIEIERGSEKNITTKKTTAVAKAKATTSLQWWQLSNGSNGGGGNRDESNSDGGDCGGGESYR